MQAGVFVQRIFSSKPLAIIQSKISWLTSCEKICKESNRGTAASA